MAASERWDCYMAAQSDGVGASGNQKLPSLSHPHAASHPPHLLANDSMPSKAKERKHNPTSEWGKCQGHAARKTWNGKYCCGQFGKYHLIGLEHPSSIFYFRVFLTILTRRSLSSNLFRNLILEVNSLRIKCQPFIIFIKYI